MSQYEESGATLPGDQILAISPIRQAIASRMQQSVTDIPRAWLMIEVDVTNLVALRQKLKETFLLTEGFPLTISPFVIKGIVNALKEFPLMNASWTPEGIAVKRNIHISVAIGSEDEDAVIAPVLRHADRKSIAGLAFELFDLLKRAKAGTLRPAEMQGDTFTFHNTGAFGSMLSYPIIQPQQAANLTFESIVRKPVVIQEMIAIRSMVSICLSFDHRILDGMICGRFLQRVKHYLEKYDLETLIY
ncbi:dihydrolipoamide acetyltransferase family protein [Paenibacillus chondroitinus]|uniref:Dihydrolipoamide acetyltransferase family protein n=1 Tax=Paenibacillus chondroitinus TaxID=59842 RepID=A0ABU6DKA3_9BACL|nr:MULTISPECIES: dihydrolipoamide acetyltransferase family protein [Paenibacillus]MCY9660613.1 2-oxo acid dehydrogenase subunit E2 [Paenibacillus anseongense]MEB4798207.1 dihydrolipoamide acetyltransferase family protein [Paenibacillus chondroitinus]